MDPEDKFSFASHAPEVDNSANAPEHDRAAEGLRPFYRNTQDLELAFNHDAPIKVEAAAAAAAASSTVKSSKIKLASIFALCLVVLAIALGVGLGVGLPRSSASSSSTPPVSVPTPPLLKNGVMNDSYLATLTTLDNNRHLFFQDINGSLRHTVFDHAANSWANKADFILTDATPRAHTPIAAIDTTVTDSDWIQIFFVDSNNQISAVSYPPAAFKDPVDLILAANQTLLAVAPNSSTLSIAHVPSSLFGQTQAIFSFEAPNGNITLLHGSFYRATPGAVTTDAWVWQNVSEAIYSVVRPSGTWLSAPLSSVVENQDFQNESFVLTFFNPLSLSTVTAPPILSAHFDNWQSLMPNSSFGAIGSEGLNAVDAHNVTASAVQQSDLITYSYGNAQDGNYGAINFVQDQTLRFDVHATGSGVPISNPDTSYIFARLSWLNSTQDGALFIYHQVNETALAEEAYYITDVSRTNYINIGS